MLLLFGLAENTFAQFGANILKFDKSKFDASVKKTLDGKVMGYQVILLKNGQTVSEIADGRARNQADGEADMTLNTPSNIGSTSKFVASVALLHLFENRKALSVDSWLDQKIYLYLPKVWQDNMHASIKEIKFRHLIEHKAGFIHNDPDCNTKMYPCLVKGVSKDQSKPYALGKRNYANANIQALAYLIPAVFSLSNKTELDALVAQQNLKGDDQQIHDFLATRYENYVRTNLFNKMSPTIKPSCHAPE
jgi:CubicO group peptidase (beta-lactamase class C family)